MKLNNKGFAISVILYTVIILVIGVLYLLLSILNARYSLSKRTNNDVVEYINQQGVNTINAELASKIATNRIINTNQLFFQNGNYYYTGSNPNNYITFNNELWRIVGVFSNNNVKYLKLIRNNSLRRDTLNNSEIINSDIFSELNGTYYNEIVGKNMIQSMSFSNSEYATNLTPFNAYQKEKEAITDIKHNVGLINGSDFGYTAGSAYLGNNLSTYSGSIGNNWLAFDNNYFTMTYNGNKINVVGGGNLISTDNKTADIYPVVYIKKDVLIMVGEGTIAAPYILSID